MTPLVSERPSVAVPSVGTFGVTVSVFPSAESFGSNVTGTPANVNVTAPPATLEGSTGSENVTTIESATWTSLAPAAGTRAAIVGAVRSTSSVTGALARVVVPKWPLATRVWLPSLKAVGLSE